MSMESSEFLSRDQFSSYVDRLRKRFGTYKQLAESVDVCVESVTDAVYQRNRAPTLASKLGFEVLTVYRRKSLAMRQLEAAQASISHMNQWLTDNNEQSRIDRLPVSCQPQHQRELLVRMQQWAKEDKSDAKIGRSLGWMQSSVCVITDGDLGLDFFKQLNMSFAD